MPTCNMPDHYIGPQHPWAFLSHIWSVNLGLGELSPGLLGPSNFSKCCVAPWVCSVCTLCCVGGFVWMHYLVLWGVLFLVYLAHLLFIHVLVFGGYPLWSVFLGWQAGCSCGGAVHI